MLVKNVTQEDLDKALAKVNQSFDGNIKFRSVKPAGCNKYRLTLTVNDSHKAGGRWNCQHNRRIAAACWHAYGTFFDALPQGAVIVANGQKIRPGDTWKDDLRGSYFEPVYYSEMCDCGN